MKSVETDHEMTKMLELVNRDFNTVIINMLKGLWNAYKRKSQ